jgi:hypothetical protein
VRPIRALRALFRYTPDALGLKSLSMTPTLDGSASETQSLYFIKNKIKEK